MSFAKRDKLREIELAVQQKWETTQRFEADAPAAAAPASKDKFFANFPYCYMNGRCHLGHTFAFSKVEYQVRFQEMLGKQVLLPFAYHCTGMPIKAAADKLAAELKEFGNPPVFPDAPHFGRVCLSAKDLATRQFVYTKTRDQVTAEIMKQLKEEETAAKKAGKKTSNKSKALQKSGGAKRQWDIMLASGVAVDEIEKFTESTYWLQYFPPHWQSDMKTMGACIDFRRSFITTDKNPYYDSFIRWQFRCLEKCGKLKFGKRHSIYSPKDGQSCADHDRASGEGVAPQEYTLIKIRLLAPFPKSLAKIEGREVFLVAATLRPETMYGQTNCFILPTGDYGCFEVSDKSDGDIFIMSDRAARNLSFQGHSPAQGKTKCVCRVKGADLIGCAISAPLTPYKKVFVLPMTTILMNKGTGVVTSVPSDAPDDWAALRDLQQKPDWRKKWGLTEEMVKFEPIPIMRTQLGKYVGDEKKKKDVEEMDPEAWHELSAVAACDYFKVTSANQAQQLAKAKDATYKAGFYSGEFTVGDFKGKKVVDVKNEIRDKMIADNEAMIYFEPAGVVISRSGDECVVCLTDQWYIDYSQREWKDQVVKHINETLESYNPELKQLLLLNVERLHEWGCSRSFGLGTHLPLDEQYVIESLSDSTIYMAYYTVAHFLQAGNIDPNKVVVGPLGIKPEQCTDALWDYVFRGEGDAAKVGVDVAHLEKMRNEFMYWYPWNLRTSGRDLAYNHLPFSLFNHVALFPPEQWPLGIKCCPFLEVDGKKMSKSAGNFLMLAEAVEKYTADGVRIALADAGDFLDIANFEQHTANNAILRLYELVERCETVNGMEADKDALREDDFDEKVLEHFTRQAIVDAKDLYEKMMYREVLKIALFGMSSARERYTLAKGDAARKDTLIKSLKAQARLLAPIAPHFAEHVSSVFGESGTLLWPEELPVDTAVLFEADHVTAQRSAFRRTYESVIKPKKKSKNKTPPVKPTKADIQVSRKYIEWQARLLDVVRPHFSPETKSFPKDITKIIEADEQLTKLAPAVVATGGKKKKGKNEKLIFFGGIRTIAAEVGTAALALELPFDEVAAFERVKEDVRAEFDLSAVTVTEVTDGKPGHPRIMFSADEQ